MIGEFWDGGEQGGFHNCIIHQTMRLKADLTLLLVAIVWGSAFVAQRMARQMGAARFESMTFSVGQLIICGLFNLVIGIFVEPGIQFRTLLALLIGYTAFFSLGLCYTLQVWAQKHTPPANAALLLSLESVFSVISGWLLLDEKLIMVQVMGCVLIFGAVLLSQLKEWNVQGTIAHDHLIEGR